MDKKDEDKYCSKFETQKTYTFYRQIRDWKKGIGNEDSFEVNNEMKLNLKLI